MLDIRKITFLMIFVFHQNHILSDLLEDGILKKNSQNVQSCLVYKPYLGKVQDIESLDIKSDKFEITDQKTLILNGNVEIDFPDGILKSGKARVDQENGLVNFKKNGDLYLEDYFFRASTGSFDKDKLSLELEKGEMFLNTRGLIINFDALNGNIDNKIIFDQVSMTSCADKSNGWELVAESIVLNDQSMRGYAKKVKVKAFDRTILKLPYIPFATSQERMTGFLEPKLSYSSDGLDFMIPYYQVVSNKSDITIALRNISDRGAGLEGNVRKLHGESNNLRNIDLFYFNNDKEHRSNYPAESKSRWAFGIKDTFGKKENIWMTVDWSKTSDSLVLRDIPGDVTSIGNQREQNLKQNINIYGAFKNIKIKISQEGYQTLNPLLTNGYKKAPSINIEYFNKFKKISIREYVNITEFRAENLHGFFGNQVNNNKFQSYITNPIEGRRTFYNLEISNSSNLNGYKLMTAIGLKGIDYDLENKNSKTNSILVPTFILDLNTLFIKKDGVTQHILKPRFFYGYVGHEYQNMNPIFDSYNLGMMNQLFNTYRFTGMDRIGDQNFYTLSVEYKKRQMNMSKLSLKISQKFYQNERKVFINDMNMNSMENKMMSSSMVMGMTSNSMDMGIMSNPMGMNMMPMMNGDKGPLVIMGKWMPSMKTMVMTMGSYSEEMKKFPMAGITINQKFEKGRIGYAKRYTKMTGDFNNKLDYSELFADFRIKDNFNFIAMLKRDDDSGSKIESSIGIGYENCCFIFKITASDKNLSKYLDGYESSSYTYLNEAWDNIIRIENKSRINFEFKLKGLNSSFDKISRFMNNSILNH